MGIHEDKYLYYFTDNCLYDYCSWTGVGIENPIITEFKNAFIPKNTVVKTCSDCEDKESCSKEKNETTN